MQPALVNVLYLRGARVVDLPCDPLCGSTVSQDYNHENEKFTLSLGILIGKLKIRSRQGHGNHGLVRPTSRQKGSATSRTRKIKIWGINNDMPGMYVST